MGKAELFLLCIILAGCGGGTSRRGPIDPALTTFISSDTVALAGIHMDSIRTTLLYRKLAAQQRWPRFGEFSTDDVHDVLLTSDGKDVLAVARGEFKGKRPDSLESLPYKGHMIYVKDEHTAIAFLDDHVALAAPPATVRAAIDQWARHADAAPRDLMTRAQALPADAQIWAVVSGWKGAGAERLQQMGNAANLDRMLRSVGGANLTVDLRTGAHAAATGDCRTEADAKTLSESLRGLAGFARIGVPKNQPELARVLDGIQVRQEGHMVKLNVDVPEDVAEQVLK